MIFDYEVQRCIEGRASLSERRDAVEHHSLGGYHQNVPDRDRAAFKAWLSSDAPLPNQYAAPVVTHPPGQLELLEPSPL